MSTITRFILAAIGLWCLGLIFLFIFPHVLPIATGFAGLVSLPFGFLLLVLALIALVKERRKLLPMISIALIICVAYIAASKMVTWGALAHLYLHKATYQATADRMLEARDDAERKGVCREECWLLSSDPGRVAFHYVHGFLNWHDIVYDPGGTLDGIKTWDERRRLNTYFISAEHLTGHWYLCHFGD
jgi:hypothetical protein